jgi:hypothetical protein
MKCVTLNRRLGDHNAASGKGHVRDLQNVSNRVQVEIVSSRKYVVACRRGHVRVLFSFGAVAIRVRLRH